MRTNRNILKTSFLARLFFIKKVTLLTFSLMGLALLQSCMVAAPLLMSSVGVTGATGIYAAARGDERVQKITAQREDYFNALAYGDDKRVDAYFEKQVGGNALEKNMQSMISGSSTPYLDWGEYYYKKGNCDKAIGFLRKARDQNTNKTLNYLSELDNPLVTSLVGFSGNSNDKATSLIIKCVVRQKSGDQTFASVIETLTPAKPYGFKEISDVGNLPVSKYIAIRLGVESSQGLRVKKDVESLVSQRRLSWAKPVSTIASPFSEMTVAFQKIASNINESEMVELMGDSGAGFYQNSPPAKIITDEETKLVKLGKDGEFAYLGLHYEKLLHDKKFRLFDAEFSKDSKTLFLDEKSYGYTNLGFSGRQYLLGLGIRGYCEAGQPSEALKLARLMQSQYLNEIMSLLKTVEESGDMNFAKLAQGLIKNRTVAQLGVLQCLPAQIINENVDLFHQLNVSTKLLVAEFDDLEVGATRNASRSWRQTYTLLLKEQEQALEKFSAVGSTESKVDYMLNYAKLFNHKAELFRDAGAQQFVRTWVAALIKDLSIMREGIPLRVSEALVSVMAAEKGTGVVLVYKHGAVLPELSTFNVTSVKGQSDLLRNSISNQARTSIIKKSSKTLFDQLGLGKSLPKMGINTIWLEGGGVLEILPTDVLFDETPFESIDVVQIDTIRTVLSPSKADITHVSKNSLILGLGNPDYGLTPSRGKTEQSSVNPQATLVKRFSGETGFAPLPETSVEIQKIAALFPSTDVVMGQEATKDALIRKVGKSEVVHIATHAFYAAPADKGLSKLLGVSSGIALSGANQKLEGIFYAGSSSQLDLTSTRLVVLSACRTALGESQKGGQIKSLRYAFSRGGERFVISTLWDIPSEATVELMGYFYESLAQGNTVVESLRNAKGMMKKGKNAHPLFWSGFTLST